MLSLLGWLNGISALGYVIFGTIVGIMLFYKGIKTNAKPLTYLGLSIFFGGLLILGPAIDYITIIITGRYLDNSFGIVGILSSFSAPLGNIFALLSASEVLKTKNYGYRILISAVLGIIWELMIFIYPLSSFNFTCPEIPGGDVIDTQISFRSPLLLLALVFLLSLFYFNGILFYRKGNVSTGILRKKFRILSLGYIFYVIGMLLESLVSHILVIVLIRLGLMICFWLWYVGLREEPEEPIKEKFEINVKEGLFRLTHKSLPITEEEVTFYKQSKICLICKKKVERFDIYICPKCSVLYCKKCAQHLVTADNKCWVCNSPIDTEIQSKNLEMKEMHSKIK